MKRKGLVVFLAILLGLGFLWSEDGRSAPASAKRLIIAVGMEPVNMDPTLIGEGGDYPVVENYGEYLVYRQPDGELKPGLATAWKVSPDGKVIEFTLRKGVKFHSGDPMTVKDVIFSYERGRAKNPVVKTRLTSVEKFEVIDDYTFKVHFKAPDVTFLPLRGGQMIVSKSHYDKVGEDAFIRQPVSTGPYKFVRYLNGEYVDLERFEDYWGPKPQVREVRFVFVQEDTTRLAKLMAGEVDLINSVPYPSVKDLETSKDFKTVRLALHHPTRGIVFQTLNPKVPWYDKRVRQAMAYAIDRRAIIDKLLNGIPNLWAWQAPEELGYDPAIKYRPYDPRRAKQLLAEAGYPNGFEVKFYWPVAGRVPMSREICEAVASYFEAVGIRTQLVGEEQAAFYARRRSAKEPKAEFVCYFTAGLAGAVDPAYNLALYFSKDGAFSLYSNPEIDKITAEAKATVNDAKRGELIKKAVAILQDDVPAIPIVNNVTVFGMKKNVDFTPTKKHNMDLILVRDITVK